MQKWRTHWALEKLLFFWCIFNHLHLGKKQVLKKTYEKVWRLRKEQNETQTPLFFPHSSNSSNTRVYIYIYISHTSLNPPIMFSMTTSTSSLLGKQLSSSSSKHLTKQQPKRHNKINVKIAAMSNVSRNPNMAQLRAGYLFPEIARIRNAHLEKNPDAKIISLGIGDTTVRFCFVFFAFFDLILSDWFLITCRVSLVCVFDVVAKNSHLSLSLSLINRNQSQRRSCRAWPTQLWR